jgi:WD40-like Beta Propeller Repeat
VSFHAASDHGADRFGNDALALGAGPAGAVVHGANGRSVIFMANKGIWQVAADGSGLHELFAAPAGTGFDDGPACTPAGKHIVITRCCPEGFGYSLWTINSAGTGPKDVTKEPFVNGDGPADTTPQVSPDGKRIVFNRCFPDQPLRRRDRHVNGEHLREPTDNSLFDANHPNWSPDSKKIVFTTQALSEWAVAA